MHGNDLAFLSMKYIFNIYIHIHKANVYWNFRKGVDESYGYKIWISAYHDSQELDIINGVQFLLQYKDVEAERQGCGAITFKEGGQFQL